MEMALGYALDLISVVIAGGWLLDEEVMTIWMNGSISCCWLVQVGQME